MTDAAKIDRLFELLREEFVRCTFPNGRDAYMRDFEAKFETSVNNINIGAGINRAPLPFWKTTV